MHAERLMEDILDIADNDAKGPDGRVDSGAVQRDRLRCDVRHLRAAALDPARWGRKTEQTIKGDAANPLVIEDAAAAEERRIDAFMAFMARTSGPQRPRELSGFGRPEVSPLQGRSVENIAKDLARPKRFELPTPDS